MISNSMFFENIYFMIFIAMLLFFITIVGSFKKIKILRIVGYLGLIIITLTMYIQGFMDIISLIFSSLTLIIGFSSSMYSDIYEVEKYKSSDLHILIDLFALSIYLTFLAPNIALFIVFWFISEIIGFFVIVYEVTAETFKAGLRYLVVSMVPADLALMTLLAYLSLHTDFLNALPIPLTNLHHVINSIPSHISLAIILGFLAKAAITPLHIWLPDAHSLAPAPASALLSGVMVKMGVYGVLRSLPIVDTTITPLVCIILGGLSAVYGGFMAVAQSDIKRILAYSTIENTGFVIISLMIYHITKNMLAYSAFVSLVMAHALFKSALFLNSGTIEVLTHTREIDELGFLVRVAPKASTSALISTLSLIGLPPTLGFIAKLLLITILIQFVTLTIYGVFLLVSVVIALALTIVYGIKYLTIYWGLWRAKKVDHINPYEEKMVLWEYIPALLNLILSPLTPVILSVSITLETITSILLASILFIVITIYVHMRTKSLTSDKVWLGGELS